MKHFWQSCEQVRNIRHKWRIFSWQSVSALCKSSAEFVMNQNSVLRKIGWNSILREFDNLTCKNKRYPLMELKAKSWGTFVFSIPARFFRLIQASWNRSFKEPEFLRRIWRFENQCRTPIFEHDFGQIFSCKAHGADMTVLVKCFLVKWKRSLIAFRPPELINLLTYITACRVTWRKPAQQ